MQASCCDQGFGGVLRHVAAFPFRGFTIITSPAHPANEQPTIISISYRSDDPSDRAPAQGSRAVHAQCLAPILVPLMLGLRDGPVPVPLMPEAPLLPPIDCPLISPEAARRAPFLGASPCAVCPRFALSHASARVSFLLT